MRIKTSLPSFAYIKLTDKKYAFVDQDRYIKMSVEDFLMFYRSVILYIEYVEDVEPEYYDKVSSILPESKIIKKIQEVKQNDVLEEKEQVIVDESSETEKSTASISQEPEKNKRRRGTK